MTPVPLFALFASKVLLGCGATKSNNVKGGTFLAEAEGAMKYQW